MAIKQGTAKNDKLTGTKAKDQLAGLDGNDVLRGLGGADQLVGGNGIDRLEGGDGNDYLDGGAGDDDLRGGKGNDLYIVDHAKDITLTLSDPGVDRVVSLISYTLGSQQEELVLFGKSKINGTGNAGDNFLVGNDGVNILSGLNGRDELNGGKGRDILRGGGGDDTYVIDNAREIELGRADPGQDRVLSSVSYTLGAHQENLQLLGTGKLSGTGNAGDNSISGNAGANVLRGNGGNDVLFGGAGIDSLHGGAGNDEYTIDNANEIDKSEADPGHDSVAVNFNYTLGAHQEDLYIYRVGGQIQTITITGNGAVNFLGGSPLSGDALFGGDGDDVLNGGAGDDHLAGQGGNDTYYIDSILDIEGDEDLGIDTVYSSVDYALGAQQEKLILIGNAVNARGNTGDNFLGGNELSNDLRGGLGDDTLNGGLGDDNLLGEEGNDTYFVDHDGDINRGLNDPGTDEVRSSIDGYVLGDNQENLQLLGTADLKGTGNRFANTLTGNSGQNLLKGGDGDDELDGLGGDDDLQGEGGNDTYTVDHAGDIGTAADPGRDRVNSIISYTLGAEQEELVLLGTTNLSGTGNAKANLLVGNGGQNLLLGGEGNDELNGLGGDDDLRGEGGDDTYFVDHADDINVSNAAADPGRDRVNSIISYTLGAEQEELVLLGTSNLNGTGNAGNNLLLGNSGVNELRGGAGNDDLRGAGGADQLFGEAGNDLLNYHAAAAVLDGGADTDGLFVTGTGPTTLLDLTAAGGPQITDIEDILFDAAGGTSAQQIAQTYTLRVAAADVLDLSSTDDLVKVLGEAGDTIELVGTWTADTQLAADLEVDFPDFQFQAWTHVSGAQIATLEAVTVTFV
ncbi:MAG: hypothetical protein AB7P42_18850 [Gammaproteobacteria bacterium]